MDTDRDAATRGEGLLASVDTVLLAQHVRPDESLAVHLMGNVGPNGSYALDALETSEDGGRVVIRPRVRRVPGDMFTQMLVPLDATIRLQLAPGEHVVEVQGLGRTLTARVRVDRNARRDLPFVEIVASPTVTVGADVVVPLRVEARVPDGWVDRIEVREWGHGQASAWRAPEFVERLPGGLRAMVSLRRPPGDLERRLEARALDGQGALSEVAAFEMPARGDR